MKQIKVQTPRVVTSLPAHEQAARRRRTRTQQPGIPGPRTPRTPKPPTPALGARKTFDTRLLESRSKFQA